VPARLGSPGPHRVHGLQGRPSRRRPRHHNTPAREFAMGVSHPSRREKQRLLEVFIDEHRGVGRCETCIAGQAGQYRISLHEGVAAQTQCPSLRPRENPGVVRVRRHQQRYGDARVDSCGRSRGQRRPESINAYIISSVTTVSPWETRRPSASRSSRAVRPPRVICTPLP